MKTCPKCTRTYEDETLSFCLEDGSLLSAPFDPDATVARGAGEQHVRITDPGYRPEPETLTYVTPPQKTWSPSSNTATPQKSIAPHVIYAAAGLFGIIIIAGTIGGLIWLTSGRTDSTQEKTNYSNQNVTSTPSPTKDPGTTSTLGPRLYDTALDGTNLTYYQEPSIDRCESDCARNSMCKGYAWIKAGTYNQNDAAMCYLVSVVTKSVPANGHTSAVKGGL